jgi:hypothetical protein
MKTDPNLWRTLRVGDRLRLVEIPRDFLNWDALHLETKQAYEYLLKRRRPVTVYVIDEWGLPWVSFRLRDAEGHKRHESMAMNHGGIVTVSARPIRRRE